MSRIIASRVAAAAAAMSRTSSAGGNTAATTAAARASAFRADERPGALAATSRRPIHVDCVPTSQNARGEVTSGGHIALRASYSDILNGCPEAINGTPDKRSPPVVKSHESSGNFGSGTPYSVKGDVCPIADITRAHPWKEKEKEILQSLDLGDLSKEDCQKLAKYAKDFNQAKHLYFIDGDNGYAGSHNCVSVTDGAMQVIGRSEGGVAHGTTPDELFAKYEADKARRDSDEEA